MRFIFKWWISKQIEKQKDLEPIYFSEYCLFWLILPFIIIGFILTIKDMNKGLLK